jgi:hypothetical protein
MRRRRVHLDAASGLIEAAIFAAGAAGSGGAVWEAALHEPWLIVPSVSDGLGAGAEPVGAAFFFFFFFFGASLGCWASGCWASAFEAVSTTAFAIQSERFCQAPKSGDVDTCVSINDASLPIQLNRVAIASQS